MRFLRVLLVMLTVWFSVSLRGENERENRIRHENKRERSHRNSMRRFPRMVKPPR